MNNLFVYGSLKRSGSFHHLIQNEVELLNSDCYTRGILISLGKYPGLVDGNGIVFGELFEITDEGLRICDEIEGYSSLKETNKNFYCREKRDIFDLGKSLICSAIVYILNSTEIYFEWKNNNCKLEIGSNLVL